MPRYKILELRGRHVEYLIDAASEEAARRFEGEVVEESGDADDWGERIISVDEVEPDAGL